MEDSYDGFATMFMRMPMSASSLPIQGSCQVTGRRLCLRFPFTGIEFDLPRSPEGEWGDEMEFKIRGACGDMVVVLGYVSELQAFKGIGKLESHDDDVPLLTFFFFRPDSPSRIYRKSDRPVWSWRTRSQSMKTNAQLRN